MKTVEEIARGLVLVMYQHDAFESLDTLEQVDWMRLAHHVRNNEIDARIEENIYYLGYDKSVNGCVLRDAKIRIQRLEEERETYFGKRTCTYGG